MLLEEMIKLGDFIMSTVTNSQYGPELTPQYREFLIHWDRITGGSARAINRAALTVAIASIPGLPVAPEILVNAIMGFGEEFNTQVWYPMTREFMDKHIQPWFEPNPVVAFAKNWFG